MRKLPLWLTILVATCCLSAGSLVAQQIPASGVTVLVNRDDVNVRLLPALGAEILGFVDAGYTAEVFARSGDSQWVRINFNGEHGWIGTVVLNVLSGDLNSVPIADPRTIPYGGFESPRAGVTDANGPIQGRLADNGVRVRSGPGRGYAILANAPRLTVFPILGRTAANNWFQVNFEGTLGWVSAQEVTIQGAFDINTLPVDGIVASGLVPSQATEDDYLGTLRFLRDRVNLAQPSLDAIRAIWTDVALDGVASCSDFPARPTDYNIPVPLLAAFNQTLNPLQTQFNDAMANVRIAIDLLIDICSRPQPPDGSVGQAVVQGALDAVNLADAQFTELRRRLNELIPPDRVAGPNECLFEFAASNAILDLLQAGRIYVDHFFPRRTITGYCFDAAAGTSLTISTLELNGNLALFMAVSPFDNPTQFLAVGTSTAETSLLTVSVNIPANGRYLIIVTDRGGAEGPRTAPPEGDFAILINNPVGGTTIDVNQTLDLATDQIAQGYNVAPILPFSQAPTPVFTNPTPAPGFTPGAPISTAAPVVFCPGLNLTCNQLTCQQAAACLQAGNFTLDPDNDNIPCEENGCQLVTG